MSPSTIRADTVVTGLPTDPILRSASAPSRAQVTGDISVWPNTATLAARGKASAIWVSSVRGQPEVDRDRDRAQGVGGEHGLEELRRVRHHDGHPVPGADAALAHGGRDRADPLVKLRPGDRAAFEAEVHSVRFGVRVP